MSFPTITLLKIGIPVVLVAGLGFWGTIQKLNYDVAMAENESLNQSLINMQSSLNATQAALFQRKTDSQIKDALTQALEEQRKAHEIELADARDNVKVVIEKIIETVIIEAEPEKAQKITQEVITNSYDCIEAASGSDTVCIK